MQRGQTLTATAPKVSFRAASSDLDSTGQHTMQTQMPMTRTTPMPIQRTRSLSRPASSDTLGGGAVRSSSMMVTSAMSAELSATKLPLAPTRTTLNRSSASAKESSTVSTDIGICGRASRRGREVGGADCPGNALRSKTHLVALFLEWTRRTWSEENLPWGGVVIFLG